MAEFDPDPEGSGPALVTTGPEETPAVLVLDPAGAAKHADIPASWHSLAGSRQVTWCRLTVDGALAEVDRRLDAFAVREVPVDLLTSGLATEQAILLARRWAAAVRSLLLVDPAAPDDRFAAAEADAADSLWEYRAREQLADLADAGVLVRVIAHSTGDAVDRVPPPLPLGHPYVVAAVRETLDELDATAPKPWIRGWRVSRNVLPRETRRNFGQNAQNLCIPRGKTRREP